MSRPAVNGWKRSPETAAKVCELIAQGYTLRQIAKECGAKTSSVITLWTLEDDDFAAQYARAKVRQADHFAEEIREIADEGKNDWMEREGYKTPDHELVARSRLRVDARKWLMAKMAPKRYGDTVAITGAEGGPVEIAISQVQRSAQSHIAQSFGLTIEHEAAPASLERITDAKED